MTQARIHDRLNSRFKNGPLRFWQKRDARRNIGATLILREDPDPTITFAWLAFNNLLTLFALYCRHVGCWCTIQWPRGNVYTLTLRCVFVLLREEIWTTTLSNECLTALALAARTRWESRRYYTRVACKNYTRDSIKSHTQKTMGVMPFCSATTTACISYSKPNLCLWRRQFGVGWQ